MTMIGPDRIDPEKLDRPVSRVELWRLLSAQNEINSAIALFLLALRSGTATAEMEDRIIELLRAQNERTTSLIVVRENPPHG